MSHHYRRSRPVEPPPVYTPGVPDWRSQGPAAQVLNLPVLPEPAQPVLEINALPGRHLRSLIALVGQRRVERELNVHRTTVRRWLSGAVRIPGHQHLAIRALLGDLPGTAGRWSGWRFHDGSLCSPAGDTFSAGDVLAIVLLRQQLTAQRREIDALRVQLAMAEQSLNALSPAANDERSAGYAS